MVNKITSPITPLGQIDKINEIIDTLGTGGVDIDNSTITQNASDELQAVGVIDQNAGGAVKTWTGTLAQYNAIATKDSGTVYNITDDDTALAYEAYSKSEVDTLLQDALYYKAGDTITFSSNQIFAGYLTTNKTNLSFTIPLPKRLDNITSVTATNMILDVRMGTAGYLPSYQWDALANADSISYSLDSNLLKIVILSTTLFQSASNNIALVVAGTISLTLE